MTAPLTPIVDRALHHLANEGACAASQTTGPGFISTRHLTPLLRHGLAERFTTADGHWRYRLTVAGHKRRKTVTA